ncbi:MAG: signal peptidase I [Dehalococcoidia bacterium]|nr:signal peptidase I [Dehalococcoidia bacterium]
MKPTWLAPAAMVVLLAALWLLVGPARLGGPVSLAITHGTSMEPMFSTGDLVFVRKADRAAAGDVILYGSDLTGQSILHRVIALTDSAHITRGDNNSWVDLERPAVGEIDGRYWFHLPRVGAWVSRLQSPRATGAFGGVFVAIIAMAASPPPPGSRRRHPLRVRGERRRAGWSLAIDRFAAGLLADTIMAALAVFLAAAIMWSGWVYSLPTKVSGTQSVLYAHTGTWSYSAEPSREVFLSTPGGGVMPNPLLQQTLTTGQPLFVATHPLVDFTFRYTVTGSALTVTGGRVRLLVLLRENVTGWRQEFELAPWTDFIGRTTELNAEVDLPQAMAIFTNLQEAVGLRGPVYAAVLVAEVELNGSVGDVEVADSFRPFATFRVDLPGVVRPLSAESVAQDAAAGIRVVADLPPDPFHQIDTRSVSVPTEEVRTMRVLFWDADIVTLRIVFAGVEAGTALTALGLYLLRRRSGRRGELFAIKARYGYLLVRTSYPPVDPDRRRPVEVQRFDELVAIAASRDEPVVYVETPAETSFFVVDLPNAIYSFVLPNPDEVVITDARALLN